MKVQDMVVVEAKGTNGVATLYENKIVFSRSTAGGFAMQGFSGDKTFYLKDITSVDFKAPTFLAPGYLKITTPGTAESDRAQGTSLAAAKNPNTIIFRAGTKKATEASKLLYNQLMDKIEELK